MTTFERRLIADKRAWVEPKNPYYTFCNHQDVCEQILREFGLEGEHCHIINGHVPVKVKEGEHPVKGGGKLVVIDGGFCRAYQPTTGIAGCTLIYDSHCYRLVFHRPFAGRQAAIHGQDIVSTTSVFEELEQHVTLSQTDQGLALRQREDELESLLLAYRMGRLREQNKYES